MVDGVALSVVIPSYREGSSLTALLPDLRGVLERMSVPYEVLVIDTESSLDDTSEVCRLAAVRHVRRRGGERYGDAVRTGIAEANGSHVLFMDADGSHDPNDIVTMWSHRLDHEIVIGSRYVAGGSTDNETILVAMSYSLCWVFQAVFKLPVRDVSTSFRLYDAAVLDRLQLHARDFDILQEILIKALKDPRRIRIMEVPVIFRRRIAGESKRRLWSFMLAYLKTLIKLKTGIRSPRELPSL